MVHLVIDRDPLHQQCELAIRRERRQHIGTLRDTDPAILTFLNDLLCTNLRRKCAESAPGTPARFRN